MPRPLLSQEVSVDTPESSQCSACSTNTPMDKVLDVLLKQQKSLELTIRLQTSTSQGPKTQPRNGVDRVLTLFASNTTRMDTLPGTAGQMITHLLGEAQYRVNHTLPRRQTNSPCHKDKSTVYEKAVGECPVVTVLLGEIYVTCLFDSGSEESTITGEFFNEHFRPQGNTFLPTSNWLRLTAANGLEIPYVGYLELDLEALVVMINDVEENKNSIYFKRVSVNEEMVFIR